MAESKCVVFVPGILGSGLKIPGKEVWPPSLWEVAFGYNRVNELRDDRVTPTGIITEVGIFKVYRSLVSDIQACGYSEGNAERRYVPFPYDWRKSNANSASALAGKLTELFPDPPDDLEITLLGHSMGGLVLRYLLESGRFQDQRWFPHVKTMITFGTPHFGAPKALDYLQGTEGKLGLSGPDLKKLADTPNLSAVYELVPPASSAMTLDDPVRGAIPKGTDPFAKDIATTLSLDAANIDLARKFWDGVDLAKRPEHISYFFFGGGAHKTTVRNVWRGAGSGLATIERNESGDGTVPITSAIQVAVPHGFSGKEHDKVFNDRDVRTQLYQFLDAPAHVKPQAADGGVVASLDEAFGVSVNKETYARGEPIEIAVSYNKRMRDPAESFQIFPIDAEKEVRDVANVKPVAVEFKGVDLTTFSFSISIDLEPGLYELSPLRKLDDPDALYFIVR